MGAGGVARAKVLGRAVKNAEFHAGTWRKLIFGSFRLQKVLLDRVDMLLPNSLSEMRRLCRYFGLDMEEKKWIVVENGVDPKLFCLKNIISHREGVLCVARVEGLKNQLNLVRAMNGLPWTLTLIGAVAPNHNSYLSRVLGEADENVRYLGQVPQSELPPIYQRERVHVLPSWFETTGLSGLEAAAMGCNIVIAKRGDVTEYFRDMASYCEPDNVDSIREAVRHAYEEPVDAALRERILDNCTWEKAAEKTLQAYKRVLDGR
ncbi:MAG: glycosyltransferase family 4 protein [Acidobacteria bacterium]|nr:glycosyltransferase family 4 protein [Acidobacteriota bacterium]